VVKLGASALGELHQPQPRRLKSVINVPRGSTYSGHAAAEASSHRRAAGLGSPSRRSSAPRKDIYYGRASAMASLYRRRDGTEYPSQRAAGLGSPPRRSWAPRKDIYYGRASAMASPYRRRDGTGYPSHHRSAGHQWNAQRESRRSEGFNLSHKGWNEVRKKFWWRNSSRSPTTRRSGPVHRVLHSSEARPQLSSGLRRFRCKTDGRCFVSRV